MPVFCVFQALHGSLEPLLAPSWGDRLLKWHPKWLQKCFKKCSKTSPKNDPKIYTKNAIFRPQNGAQNCSKIGSKWLQNRSNPSRAPSWPKMAPRWLQDAPRWPQMAPRWPQNGPKMAQEGLEMAPRWPQDGLLTGIKSFKFLAKNRVRAT